MTGRIKHHQPDQPGAEADGCLDPKAPKRLQGRLWWQRPRGRTLAVGCQRACAAASARGACAVASARRACAVEEIPLYLPPFHTRTYPHHPTPTAAYASWSCSNALGEPPSVASMYTTPRMSAGTVPPPCPLPPLPPSPLLPPPACPLPPPELLPPMPLPDKRAVAAASAPSSSALPAARSTCGRSSRSGSGSPSEGTKGSGAAEPPACMPGGHPESGHGRALRRQRPLRACQGGILSLGAGFFISGTAYTLHSSICMHAKVGWKQKD